MPRRPKPIDRSELIDQLTRLARAGGDIARLGAVKQLLALPEFQLKDEQASGDPFQALDAGDDLSKRRADRAQAA